MAAEMSIYNEIAGKKAENKLLDGAWILSPRDKYYVRYCSFVMSQFYEDNDELQADIDNLVSNRTWQTLATFLINNHIGITVSGGVADSTLNVIEQIHWITYSYEDEQLHIRQNHEPFKSWESGTGRPSKGKEWNNDVEDRYKNANSHDLINLTMRQAFLEGYLKETLRKSFGETYDVDGFIVSFAGKVLPLEIKEKSRTPKKEEFGVDAGRILMLLRMCLMTDSNALYIIREVDESETRELINWQYITLSDLIMKCRWNLQGGGAGMGGGTTQTIMMPADLFNILNDENFSEDWLSDNGSLQNSVKNAGLKLKNDLVKYLNNE